MNSDPMTPMPEPVKEYKPINDTLTKQTKVAYVVSGLILVGVIIWSLLMV
ncbi:MAG: hypothetical protein H9W81_03310 [Enterococcus sp.]|nr:hypothetical protein [Enterococcus sp.]